MKVAASTTPKNPPTALRADATSCDARDTVRTDGGPAGDLRTSVEERGEALSGRDRFLRCRPANTGQVVTVDEADLPACCPPPEACLWNSHPRVYLPLDPVSKDGRQARCPYCSTLYLLATPGAAKAA